MVKSKSKKNTVEQKLREKVKQLEAHNAFLSTQNDTLDGDCNRIGRTASILLVGLLVVLSIAASVWAITDMDNVDVDDELGPYMCGKLGYWFEGYELRKEDKETNHEFELEIRCQRDPTIKAKRELVDGYLFLME